MKYQNTVLYKISTRHLVNVKAKEYSQNGVGVEKTGGGSQSSLQRKLLSQSRLVNMFRKPFRRKSVPSSPVAGPRMSSRAESVPRTDAASDPVRRWRCLCSFVGLCACVIIACTNFPLKACHIVIIQVRLILCSFNIFTFQVGKKTRSYILLFYLYIPLNYRLFLSHKKYCTSHRTL